MYYTVLKDVVLPQFCYVKLYTDPCLACVDIVTFTTNVLETPLIVYRNMESWKISKKRNP